MKTLEIEWKHIAEREGTCIRCADTGEALDDVVERLADECRPGGWLIEFRETILGLADISQSNIILLNGKPIENILPGASSSESHCESCCDISGESSTCCRTVEFDGISYEGIPASMIREAVCLAADCC